MLCEIRLKYGVLINIEINFAFGIFQCISLPLAGKAMGYFYRFQEE